MKIPKNSNPFSEPPSNMPHNFVNRIGMKYGKLTVIGYAGRRGSSQKIHWFCACDCGNMSMHLGNNLGRKTISCGCVNKKRTLEMFTTHGLSKTPEYKAFHKAKGRCNNPNTKFFPQYGGRGIKFLFQDFDEFLSHIGNKPSPDHSLDRIDVDGNYEVGNVRWANKRTQARNRRKKTFIQAFGESLRIADWSNRYGVNESVIEIRLRKLKWCPECAVKIQPHGGTCVHR